MFDRATTSHVKIRLIWLAHDISLHVSVVAAGVHGTRQLLVRRVSAPLGAHVRCSMHLTMTILTLMKGHAN